MKRALLLLLAAVLAQACMAAEDKAKGTATVPLAEYKALLDAAKPKVLKGKPPADFAISAVRLDADPAGDTLQVEAEFTINVAEEKWVKVPLLPATVAISDFDGDDGMLVTDKEFAYYATAADGEHTLDVHFSMPIKREGADRVAIIPRLQAASVVLSMELTGENVSASVTPSLATTIERDDGMTALEATLPPGKQVELRWLPAPADGYAFNRAQYAINVLDKETAEVQCSAELEVFTKSWLRIPIASTDAAIESVTLDGKDAILDADDERLCLVTNAAGKHALEVRLTRRVDRTAGVPALEVFSVGGSVTNLEVKLPEPNQDIQVEPGCKLEIASAAHGTTLTAQLPPTRSFTIRWTEAVAEAERVRLYAESAHVLRLAQSVLSCSSTIQFEVLRGEVSKLELQVPEAAAVRSVHCPNLRDWRQQRGALVLYLTTPLKETCKAEVELERVIKDWPADIASLHAAAQRVERDRGFVVVEKNEDYEIAPATGAGVIRIGAEALPEDLKDRLDKPAAYAFKYVKAPLDLRLETAKAPKRAAEVYAQVDTLATAKEGSLRCEAKVGLTIYKAPVAELRFKLPKDVTVLNVAAPSMRNYEIDKQKDAQTLKLWLLTRVRDDYSCTVTYERMLGDEPNVPLPTLEVVGAKIESGHVAMKSDANVEISVTGADGARRIDVAELPPALLEGDSRTLLLAFRYARRPFSVTLAFKRFQDVDVRPSVIDSANFTTVCTEDGVVITNADYTVRNKERQFLRLTLPKDADIWALTVSGKSATPARDPSGLLLVPLEKSRARGQDLAPFRVQLTYRTMMGKMKGHGKLPLVVPQADITTSQLYWSVYLPVKFAYFGLDGNVDRTAKHYVVVKAASYTPKAASIRALSKKRRAPIAANQAQKRVAQQALRNWEIAAERQKDIEQKLFSQIQKGKRGAVMPVAIALPTEGKLLRFKKIYPTEAPEPPHMTIGYARGFWRVAGLHWW